MKNFQKFAVVRIKNDQLVVNENSTYEIKKISGATGDPVNFDVLLTADADKIQVGKPLVKNARVQAEIIAQQKGKKVTTRIFKAKSRYRKTIGHRPLTTKIKISKIL
ncbi:MAG TPA: 50S ribosomal protein L21 [Candidatus Dojkabacteria bacterium]|nr:50S ribosomal protein L21 [Candidatus Dojkabacteria bacterium]